MVKKYTRVTDEQRRELIRLIYQEQYSIKRAGQEVGIPYPNAKAVNQTYLQENRTSKKKFRFRLKNIDQGYIIPRSTILIERLNPYEYNPIEIQKRTCGIKIHDISVVSIQHVTTVINSQSLDAQYLQQKTIIELNPLQPRPYYFISSSIDQKNFRNHGIQQSFENLSSSSQNQLLKSSKISPNVQFEFGIYENLIKNQFETKIQVKKTISEQLKNNIIDAELSQNYILGEAPQTIQLSKLPISPKFQLFTTNNEAQLGADAAIIEKINNYQKSSNQSVSSPSIESSMKL
eukprot:403363999